MKTENDRLIETKTYIDTEWPELDEQKKEEMAMDITEKYKRVYELLYELEVISTRLLKDCEEEEE